MSTQCLEHDAFELVDANRSAASPPCLVEPILSSGGVVEPY